MKKDKKNKFDEKNNHPVNTIHWIPSGKIFANDYNPNKVAPPEMKLLQLSIESDGFTQPIVVWKVSENHYEVIDGFHRHLVGKKLGMSELPVVIINKNRLDKSDRISSTIRHNRARGKHVIEAMSDIVIELKRRNWKNDRICRELGMEKDEVLRLCQITGLADLFTDQEFSKSWDIKDAEIEASDFIPLTDDITDDEKEKNGFRTVNTSDEERIFHTWEKWECYKAGFYDTTKEGMAAEECEKEYYDFLKNEKEFRVALEYVINNWKHSCDHYLTNKAMNRIAWLGQASVCFARGIPSTFRGGFNLLSEDQQKKANLIALEYLNKWLKNNNRNEVSLEEAMPDRESTIY